MVAVGHVIQTSNMDDFSVLFPLLEDGMRVVQSIDKGKYVLNQKLTVFSKVSTTESHISVTRGYRVPAFLDVCRSDNLSYCYEKKN